MPVRSSEDLWPPLAVLVLGMLAPAIAIVAGEELLTLYVSTDLLVGLFGVGYGLVAWYLIERRVVDRTSFLLVSVVWPWLLIIGLLFALLLLNQGEQIPLGPLADVFNALTYGWPGVLGYGGVFAVAGIAAVGLSKWYRGRASRDDRVPEPRRVVIGIGVVVAILAIAIAGVNAAVAADAAIADVSPGTLEFQDPAFNVTVEGPVAELRVSVVAPDGTSRTRRLARADMRDGSATASFGIEYGEPHPGVLPMRSGVYRVQVTSLAGLAVDSTTYRAPTGAEASLSAVATANGTLPWNDPPDDLYGRGSGDTKLGFTVVNHGDFHARLGLGVTLPNDTVTVHGIFIAPGDRAGVVISLDEETARAVRTQQDGSVTARLFLTGPATEPEATVEIELPDA